MKILESLITFENLDEATSGFVQVLGVTFKCNFGPWKAGQIVDSLALDYESAQLVEYDAKSNRVRECDIAIKPVSID